MSRYFVTDPPVAVPEFEPGAIIGADGTPQTPNTIWIKARMDVETKGRVTSELVTLGKNGRDVEFRAGANEMALLVHNIVRWEGPDLSAIPCTPENIRKLDPTEPHIARVSEAIAERNKPRETPRPNSATAISSPNASLPAGSLTSAAAHSPRSVTGISRSPLQSALDGRRSRPDDSILILPTNSSDA